MSLGAKLEQLRSLEVDLWRSHREEQDFNHTTFGARDFDPTQGTMFSRAATALSGLLDGVEALRDECADAEATAYATGRPCEEDATVTIGLVLETINGYLGDTA